jgi:hypothetical protein
VAALGFERGIDRRVRAQGMRSTRLAEPPQQHRVGGFQECDLGGNRPTHSLQNAPEAARAWSPRAHPPPARCGGSRPTAAPSPRSAESVLREGCRRSSSPDPRKAFKHGGLAGTAHPRDDDQLRSVRGVTPDDLSPLSSPCLCSVRVGFSRFAEADDFRGVMHWIVAPKVGVSSQRLAFPICLSPCTEM